MLNHNKEEEQAVSVQAVVWSAAETGPAPGGDIQSASRKRGCS